MKTKKTDAEILAARLRNLEKARAMKTLYKIQRDEEAAAAATEEDTDVPENTEDAMTTPEDDTAKDGESSSKKAVTKTSPGQKGGHNLQLTTEPLDIGAMLDAIQVALPLKQLSKHAPDINKQVGAYLGYNTKLALRASQSLMKLKWSPEQMEVDRVHHLRADTSKTEAVSVALQAV